MISTLLKPTICLNGKKYKILSQIGEGGFAYVYNVKSINKDDKHENYALKKMICQTDEQRKEAKREIEAMIKIKHSNVISLIDFSYLKNKRGQEEAYMLLPLYKCSVQSFIDEGLGFPYCSFSDGLDVVKILKHCVEGLKAIHKAGFRHSDIKPANVLISESFHVVITDLGSICPLESRIEERSVALQVKEHAEKFSTASYRPPELFDPKTDSIIDGKADIWSFGCFMYTVLFSKSPFETSNQGFSTLLVLSSKYSVPDENPWPEDYIKLIADCLKVDPFDRISIDELQSRLSFISSPPLDLHKIPSPKSNFSSNINSPTNEDETSSSGIRCSSLSERPIPSGNFADFDNQALNILDPLSLNESPKSGDKLKIQQNQSASIEDRFNDVFDTTSADLFNEDYYNSPNDHPPPNKEIVTLPLTESALKLKRDSSNSTSFSSSYVNEMGLTPSSKANHNIRQNESFDDFEIMDLPKSENGDNDLSSYLPPQNHIDLHLSESESVDFGEFFSGQIRVEDTTERAKKIESPLESVNLRDSIISQAKQPLNIIKEGFINVIRPSGFSKKEKLKKAYMVLTMNGLLIRKESAPNAKVYEVFCFAKPIALISSDTLAVGLNGLIIQGSSPIDNSEENSNSPKSQSATSQSVEDNSFDFDNKEDLKVKKFPDDEWTRIVFSETLDRNQVSMTQKICRSILIETRIEISFDSKQQLNDWVDNIEEVQQNFL